MADAATRNRNRLQLALVVIVIAVLMRVFLERMQRVGAHAERVAVQQVINDIRIACRLQHVALLAAGRADALAALDGANPVGTVLESLSRYVGEVPRGRIATVPPGSWFFSPDGHWLGYRVAYTQGFHSDLDHIARWRLQLAYQDRNGDGRYTQGIDAVTGLGLVPAGRFGWQPE